MRVQDQPLSSHPETVAVLEEAIQPPAPAGPAVSAPSLSRIFQASFSIADQALFVGGTFLANVVLARTQTKEEYGMFVLSYSIFTFLTGLHNAAILEPYTVYGSGRYRHRFSEYFRLMARSNAVVGVALTASLLLVCLLLSWFAPHLLSRSLIGLGLTVGILLSGIFLRRAFYLEGKAMLSAGVSLAYSLTAGLALWVAVRAHMLNGFSVFLILALGWIVAGAIFAARLPFGKTQNTLLDFEPQYWQQHWKYARWVLVTAFVFQLTTQGYYWLVAGFLSVREVAELRAMYLLIGPVDQVLIALSYLLLPILALHYATARMDRFVSVWSKYALATLGLTALFALAVRGLGKPVMHLLYAGKFDGLATLLFLLALLPLLMGVGNTISSALNAMERPKFVFWGFLSSGVATFVCGIPLVKHFGLQGAVYGMLVSGATYTAALAVAFLFSLRQRAEAAPFPLAPKVSDDQSEALHVSTARPLCRSIYPSKLAPIALFVYNRPEHARQALEALKGNDLAARSDLFVFSDGAKHEAAQAAVREVREISRNIEGFKSVTVIERERNFGLSKSIVAGVTQLCKEYGRAIVVEDDILTAPDFLSFMNGALDRYERDPAIFSISGFNLPIPAPASYSYDAFCSYRSLCWGWGTWGDRWEKADWSVSDYAEFVANRERQRRFNRGGNDLTWLLGQHMAGKIDSWDTVWAYTHSKHNAVALLPVRSKAYNIGFDGSGVHCRRTFFGQTALSPAAVSEYRFPDSGAPDAYFAARIQRLRHRSLPKRVVRYLYDKMGTASTAFSAGSPRRKPMKNRKPILD